MNVPFVDLKSQYAALEAEIQPAINKVLKQTNYILGEEVQAFEKEFATFATAKECVSVATGCDALFFAIKACGFGPGDEIITTANTFIATVLAITASGATPVLVDCEKDTYNMDPAMLKRAITPRTKAIMPVHLYGQAVDFDTIQKIAKEHNMAIIEDAAQAHGATYKNRACGSLGTIGCFSFYPGKNLGAYGDGGAIVTNDADLAQKIRMYRNYGQSKKYHHDVAGWNSRLDTLQAAILSVKLKHLPAWNEARRKHAQYYREHLKDLPLVLPVEKTENKHVYHLFIIQTEKRDELLAFLKSKNIDCGIHYPIPIHLQQAYQSLGYSKGAFPITEQIASRILSLPMFPELKEDQLRYVCSSIREFFT